MAPSKPQANGEKKGKPSELDFNQKNIYVSFFCSKGQAPGLCKEAQAAKGNKN